MADDAKDKAAEQGAITPAKPGASPAEQRIADGLRMLVLGAKEFLREKADDGAERILAVFDEGGKPNKKSEK